jgi:hypothetical protein
MNTATVNGGEKGVRVIVDANNENSIEVAAGTSQEVSYEGLLEVRALGQTIADPDQSGSTAG